MTFIYYGVGRFFIKKSNFDSDNKLSYQFCYRTFSNVEVPDGLSISIQLVSFLPCEIRLII